MEINTLNTKHTDIRPTAQRIVDAFLKIKKYREAKGYAFHGLTDVFIKAIVGLQEKDLIGKFDSKNQEKDFGRYLSKIEKRPEHILGMALSNKFLHFLTKKVMKMEKVYLDYSDKEKKIIEARIKWKKLLAEADLLKKEYKDEKGDFYKKLLYKS